MLKGWYCRSLADGKRAAHESEHMDSNVDVVEDDSDSVESNNYEQSQEDANSCIDYKMQYRYLKQKLKFLIYENEFFHDALRANQRRLLKVSRDRAFLLDRLLQYEKPENTSSESDDTESSEDEAAKEAKRHKLEHCVTSTSGGTRGRRKKVRQIRSEGSSAIIHTSSEQFATSPLTMDTQNEMVPVEVEAHLQSGERMLQLVSESASAPTAMFNYDQTLESESNDHIINISSPTHVAAEECVPMEYSKH